MASTVEPHDLALMPALGARASVTEAFWSDPARFRLDFTNDVKTKELRWVLFTGQSVCLSLHRPHSFYMLCVDRQLLRVVYAARTDALVVMAVC